jgi:hypothetical protein
LGNRTVAPPTPNDEELVEALKRGKVCLFVGAGASRAAGLKGWVELIEEMQNVMLRGASTADADDLKRFFGRADKLDVAEAFRTRLGENRFHQFLREEFRGKTVKLSRVHRALRRLPVTTIFTTNYDKLLERAFRNDMGDDPIVVFQAEQLALDAPNEVRVIKIHGDIDHPKSIVLTRSDYDAFPDRYAAIAGFLRHSLSFETILFVGFALQDPNFDRIYAEARRPFLGGDRRAYAVMAGISHVETALWAKRNLTILSVRDHNSVSRYIERLAARC